MEFNIKDFETMVEKINKPSVIIYGSSSAIGFLKEHWVERAVKVQFCPLPYDDDKIFVMPAEGTERVIKFEIPERAEELRRYLGIEEEVKE